MLGKEMEIEDLDTVVEYLKDNTDRFRKRRLDELYPLTPAHLSLSHIHDAGIHILEQEGVEQTLVDTARMCYDMMQERPDCIVPVYQFFAEFWRDTGYFSFRDAESALEEGVKHHPTDAPLRMIIALNYLEESVEVSHRGEHDKAGEMVNLAYEIMGVAFGLDKGGELDRWYPAIAQTVNALKQEVSTQKR